MDQPFRKPPGKRGVLGQESQDDDARVNNISSDKDRSRGFALVNEGQLYDDPGVANGGDADGGSLYDNLLAPSGEGDNVLKPSGCSEQEPESEGRERTLSEEPESDLADKGENGKDAGDLAGAERSGDDERELPGEAGTPAQSADRGGVEKGPGPAQGANRRKNSGGPKGSCPSWLKSGLYKGAPPSEDNHKVSELHEQTILNSPIGTAVIDSRGLIRMSNAAFLYAIGLDDGDTVRDIEEVGRRIKGVDVTNRFWDAVESQQDLKIEEQAEVEGRGKITLRVSFHPVGFQSAVCWCICYFEAAGSSTPTRGQLWEYQNYVACVATSSGDAIVGLDIDGNIKYWNQGAQALFGYADEEILGRPVMQLVPEELRREAQLVLKVVMEQGLYKNYDTSRVHKSGRRIPVTMTVAAVRNEDGEFVGTAATLKDLRSSKDLHEKAVEAEKLNAVLQMAVTVYHQINNPLCVIAANTQLLLSRIQGSDSEEAVKLESVLEATRRISTVLEDLGRLTGVEPQIAQPEDDK
jgi:PAS domain S-box-containing protein